MRCYRKILHISYKDHVTSEEVRAKVQQAIGPHEDLLTIVKRRKLQWYGHVSRSSGLAKTILQGTVKGERRQGRQKKSREDNIREWTDVETGMGVKLHTYFRCTTEMEAKLMTEAQTSHIIFLSIRGRVAVFCSAIERQSCHNSTVTATASVDSFVFTVLSTIRLSRTTTQRDYAKSDFIGPLNWCWISDSD